MTELAGVMVGNYFLLERVEREGMSETYQARPTTRGGCDVLLRMYHPSFPDQAGFREHFMDEAQKLWRCRHEHIQPLLEFGAGEDLLYTVTDAVEAETLEHYLERWEQVHPGATLPIQFVARWATQLCDALQFAHEHAIVHGNLRLSSMLVQDEALRFLANFSLMQPCQDSEAVITQVEDSHALYLAPEQSLGILTPACDVYAVGVLLFRLLTGHFPYEREEGTSAVDLALRHSNEPIPSLREFCPDIPEALEMVVRVALAKTPSARFGSAVALSNALLAALVRDEQPVVTANPPHPPSMHTITPRRRVRGRAAGLHPAWSRALTIMSVLVLLAGLVGILLFFAAVPFHLQDLPFLSYHVQTPPGGVRVNPGVTPTTPSGLTSSNPGSTVNVSTTLPTPIPTVTSGTTPTATNTVTATSSPVTTVTPGPTGTAVPPLVCAQGALKIDGSPYFESAVAQVYQDYNAACPGLALALHSDGIRALNLLQHNRIDMADCDLTARVSRNLTDYPVAALVFSLVASPDVAVTNLTLAQIQAIYAGQITNWSQVGGPNEAIVVMYPPAGSAINQIFRAFVLNGASLKTAGYTMRQDNPALLAQYVGQTPGAIGYVPLATAMGGSAQPVAINGIPASAQNVMNASYPFWSVEHLYTAGSGSTQAQAFAQFMQSQQETATLLSNGAVPISLLPPAILLSHLPGPQV